MAMDLDEPLGAMAAAEKGEAALRRLRDADPALYLAPSAELAAAARVASQHIYSSLAPLSPAQPPPLPELLAGPAFDAEQVWSQIELLARPLLPHLRRQLRRLEQQPPSQPPPVEAPAEAEEEQSGEDGEGSEPEELEDELKLEETDGEDVMGEEDEEEVEELVGNEVEDKFLNIGKMKEFLKREEEREYGGGAKRGEKKLTKSWMEEGSDDEDEEDGDEDEEEDEDEDQLNLEDFEDDDEEGAEDGGDVKYNEFFEKGHNQKVKKRDGSTKKVQFKDESHEIEVDASDNDEVDASEDDDRNDEQNLSTHEKKRLKMHAELEQMEKAILEPNYCIKQTLKQCPGSGS